MHPGEVRVKAEEPDETKKQAKAKNEINVRNVVGQEMKCFN